tara:strand:- start:450 stop:1148 length:699 start_codon:yes stop_codon:yes gene_type:complete
MSLFDLKANIIPQVDPDFESIVDTINTLKLIKEMNISKVCAAPSYYDSVDFDIKSIIIEIQREASKLDKFDIPELFSSIVYPVNLKFDKLDKLETINGTGYLFCQFPFHDLNKDFTDKIKALINQNYIPVLLNLEQSFLKSKLNQIKELKSIGCLISIDLFLYVNNWSKLVKDSIRRLESEYLIDIVTGFSKLENLDQEIYRFCKDSKIDETKLREIYMNENPNLITNSSKR